MQEALSGIIEPMSVIANILISIASSRNCNDLERGLSTGQERNKKSIYKVVKEGARAREYEDAFAMADARLVHKNGRSLFPACRLQLT